MNTEFLNFRITQFDGVVVVSPEPSPLLIKYRENLVTAIIKVKRGDNYGWVAVAGGWGLQYAYTVVNGGMTDPATMQVVSTSVKDLMVAEAINIGMIDSATETFFKDEVSYVVYDQVTAYGVMYHTSGNTIIPYWWTCPYDGGRFRSPEALEQHILATHSDILQLRADLVRWGTFGEWEDGEGGWGIRGIYFVWRNNSPYAITGKIDWTMAAGWDSQVGSIRDTGSGQQSLAAGVEGRINFTTEQDFSSRTYPIVKATLTLVGDPYPGFLLDRIEYFA